MPTDLLLALCAGFAVSVVTTPVGVSGAVFMLPIQMTVLGVPNPSVTPTNLLYNVIAVPGALWRFSRAGGLRSRIVGPLVVGTVPGVVTGVALRLTVFPSGGTFKALIALLFLPLGVWLLLPTGSRPRQLPPAAIGTTTLTLLGFGAGVIGGIYGIGGGSILGPVLVGLGLGLATVAPAALLTTFVTSIVGTTTYALLALIHASAEPDWLIGITAGVGGLLGGYAGASLQPRIPQRALRVMLGVLACGLAVAYLLQLLAE